MRPEKHEIKISEVIGDLILRMILFEEELRACGKRWGFDVEIGDDGDA